MRVRQTPKKIDGTITISAFRKQTSPVERDDFSLATHTRRLAPSECHLTGGEY